MIKKIKSEKGFTGTDVITAIAIMFLLVGTVTTAFVNLYKTTLDIKADSEAMFVFNDAVQRLENNLCIMDVGNVKNATLSSINAYKKDFISLDIQLLNPHYGKNECLYYNCKVKVDYKVDGKTKTIDKTIPMAVYYNKFN